MNKLFTLLALVIAVVMTSCEKEVDMGYPTSVLFTADGGENTISGIEPFTDAHIHDCKSGEQGSVLPTEGDFDRTARLFFYYHIIALTFASDDFFDFV